MVNKTFKLSSQLTFDTVQSDSKRLLNMLRDGKTTGMHLDLSDVLHCDSAGLALLIEAKRLCKQYNRVLTIDGISEEIQALAKFCGVETMLQY